MNKKLKSVHGWLLLGCSLATPSFAADFFTIIGPDGRPMIIQQKEATAKPKNDTSNIEKSERATKQVEQNVQVEQQAESKIEAQTERKIEKAIPQQYSVPSVHVEQKGQKKSEANINISREKAAQKYEFDLEKSKNNQQNIETLPTLYPSKNQQLNQLKALDSNSKVSQNDVKVPSSKDVKMETQVKASVAQANSKITEIDGVQYVDNEYLEDKEFNLEGKKRFYIMPDSSNAGGRSFQTVERQKGISKSIFSKFLKNTDQVKEPIVLASTYFRLPKEDVVQNLEQACFTGKKIEKAKKMSLNKDEIGFWPVAPIKESFAYEVVKLDTSVQNIHLSSYASSQKNPTYYWPLVVFLDQKGCVIEGVSGFKSEDVESNHTEYAALAGVLKKPEQASYLFMTPLLESVDIKTQKLSNTGQIKLSVLR